jgi:hypothetical protein
MNEEKYEVRCDAMEDVSQIRSDCLLLLDILGLLRLSISCARTDP